MILPINVKESDLKAAIAKFEAVLGKEWVFKSEEDLNLYRDAYSPQWDDEDEPIPSLALAPKNVKEVQANIRFHFFLSLQAKIQVMEAVRHNKEDKWLWI